MSSNVCGQFSVFLISGRLCGGKPLLGPHERCVGDAHCWDGTKITSLGFVGLMTGFKDVGRDNTLTQESC